MKELNLGRRKQYICYECYKSATIDVIGHERRVAHRRRKEQGQ